MNNRIDLRPIRHSDEPFLYRVYAHTRYEELARTGWQRDAQEAFLRQQFLAQHNQYMGNYTDAEFNIICFDGIDIGRLYTDIWEKEIRIIDIAILPEYRNNGFGTALIKEIQEKGGNLSKKVSIHVEKNNPALNLYHRLGFIESDDKGIYWLLEWHPKKTAA